MNTGEVRFAFGANWQSFLDKLDEERIAAAQKSLCDWLAVSDLRGKTFLDVGSGSGLLSLAARRLGARVHSFDYDPQSVACTKTLRAQFFPDDPDWRVEQGSVLDRAYLAGLGRFDIVYSWGVLHHTGAMWEALENVAALAANGGVVFIAIYNDQGWLSRYWLAEKTLYNRGRTARIALTALHAPYFVGLRYLVRRLAGKGAPPRGMSLWHDMVDWLGGLPFEVAAPEQIERFFGLRGYRLQRENLAPRRRHGCNEYLFTAADRR